jgi:ferredoxin
MSTDSTTVADEVQRIEQWLSTVRERAGRLLEGDPLFDRQSPERHVRPEPTDRATERKYDRQRWLGVGFVLLLAGGVVYPPVAVAGIGVCMVGAVGLGARRGRYWCDGFCPRGGLLDTSVRLFSKGRPAPDVLTHPLVRFGVLVAIFANLVVGIVAAWGDPVGMSMPFVRMLVVSTLAALVLGVTYHERAWCLVCPAGTMANVANRIAELLGRERAPRIAVDDEACVDCGQCTRVCRQEIAPNEYADGQVVDHGDVFDVTADAAGQARDAGGQVDHGDCMQCGDCVETCPTDALALEAGE